MGSNGALEDLMEWLSRVFGISNKAEFDNVIKQATTSKTGVMADNSIIPRWIEITLALDSDGLIKAVRGVSVDIEACLTIRKPAVAIAEEMPAVFLFTFAWSAGLGFHLARKLWTVISDTPFTLYDRALPEFEKYEFLNPVSPVLPENHLRTIDIARLLSEKKGEVKNLPAGIPNEIYLCEIYLYQEKVAFKSVL